MKNVSVVIPAYKAEHTILKAVNSALAQGTCVDEVIVVVDGELDKTSSILQKINDQRLNVIIFNENKGAQKARNKGLNTAKSEYILFLDSDDYFEGAFVEGLVQSMTSINADLCLGVNCRVYMNGEKSYFELEKTLTKTDLMKGWLIGTSAVGPTCILWKRNIINGIGGWNEKVVRNQDGDLIIRALSKGAKPSFSNVGAGCTVQHDGDRISRLRSKSSFMEQQSIYESVSSYLMASGDPRNVKYSIKAALNYFCINICMGMAESGFQNSDYDLWKKRIDWKPLHFFVLPWTKSLQALLIFVFGKKAFIVKNFIKGFY